MTSDVNWDSLSADLVYENAKIELSKNLSSSDDILRKLGKYYSDRGETRWAFKVFEEIDRKKGSDFHFLALKSIDLGNLVIARKYLLKGLEFYWEIRNASRGLNLLDQWTQRIDCPFDLVKYTFRFLIIINHTEELEKNLIDLFEKEDIRKDSFAKKNDIGELYQEILFLLERYYHDHNCSVYIRELVCRWKWYVFQGKYLQISGKRILSDFFDWGIEGIFLSPQSLNIIVLFHRFYHLYDDSIFSLELKEYFYEKYKNLSIDEKESRLLNYVEKSLTMKTVGNWEKLIGIESWSEKIHLLAKRVLGEKHRKILKLQNDIRFLKNQKQDYSTKLKELKLLDESNILNYADDKREILEIPTLRQRGSPFFIGEEELLVEKLGYSLSFCFYFFIDNFVSCHKVLDLAETQSIEVMYYRIILLNREKHYKESILIVEKICRDWVLTQGEFLCFNYLYAETLEKYGNRKLSLYYYRKVKKINPTYRLVDKKVRDLETYS